jgi:hypothetical protein
MADCGRKREPPSFEIVSRTVAYLAANEFPSAIRRKFSIMKKLITTASLIALMAVPVMAQDTAPNPSAMPAANQNMKANTASAYSGQLSADDLMNKPVKNGANESVGDINDLRIDSSGKIAAVIVGVGGFLGLGEKDVALPFEQLSFTRDGDGALVITANVTKESLQAAPEWKKPEDRS